MCWCLPEPTCIRVCVQSHGVSVTEYGLVLPLLPAVILPLLPGGYVAA